MTSITFDTLDASKTLRNAGVDERTADAIVNVVRRTTELPNVSHLATREQLERTDERLESGFKTVNGRIDDLRTTLFALFGMNIAAVLGVGAFLYTLLRH